MLGMVMFEDRAANFFLAGSVLMIIHKVESFLTGEYFADPAYSMAAGYLNQPQHVYAALIISLAVIFLLVYFVLRGGKYASIVMSLMGILLTHEAHHLIRSLSRGEYYPGALTGTICFGFSIFYWKNLLTAKNEGSVHSL